MSPPPGNRANVEALREVLDRLGYGWPDERAKMAADLAAAGVLDTASLTDEQVHSFAADRGQHFEEMEPEEFQQVREALSRIAREGA